MLSPKRFPLTFLLAVVFLAVATLLRGAFIFLEWHSLTPTPGLLGHILATGFLFDLAALSFALPFFFLFALLPATLARRFVLARNLFFIVAIYALLFDAVSEWIFWDEFQSRYNFIAVDYLIYTREVVDNIRESYPVEIILAILLVITAGIFQLLRGRLSEPPHPSPFLHRLALTGVFLLLPVATFQGVDTSLADISDNRVADEIARNGFFQFFSAFRNNQLDYETFYRDYPEKETVARLRQLVARPGEELSADPGDFARTVRNPGPEKRLHVVLVVIESLSAEYLGVFGNDKNLTPHLDQLAREGVLLTRLYATGTRTNRGLEALTLSIPPTPGHAIVNRPSSTGLDHLGEILAGRGYRTRFIYGGFGAFDNMNGFFGEHGFDLVDRTAFAEEEYEFANAWGVADEFLYDKALQQLDRSHEEKRPSFNLVLTTSNHRPFTFPKGRIEESGHAREDAIRYTDYSIHHFLTQAKTRPWFDDTLFVFVADHCAKSAGKSDLPVDRYHIPLVFYAPKHVAPGRIDTLASQIDVPPTLLSMLGVSWRGRFLGQNLIGLPPEAGRAFISNYQKLGYVRDDRLVILSPKKAVNVYPVTRGEESAPPIPPRAGEVEEAAAWYQGASRYYKQRLQLPTLAGMLPN